MNGQNIKKDRSAASGAEFSLNRRSFLGGVAALSAAAIVTPTTRILGANNRLRLGVCGVNGRGGHLMSEFVGMSDVEIAWIVDPDRRLLDRRSEQIKERAGKKPKTTTDVRKALEDPNLDGIVVATPNHWHALMVIWAAQAGKHCYVEKPACHDIYEGRVAYEAAKKYGVVVQHGTQSRSSAHWAKVIRAIHSGRYGRLAIAHAFCCKRRGGIGHHSPSEPPEWLDWNLWRGHAVIPQYNEKFVHYDWHWFWETGNGDLNNQGTHQLDIAYWALDPEMSSQLPEKVTCLGGRFAWDDEGETPNHQFGVAVYPNGQKVLMNVRNVDYDGYQYQIDDRFYFEDGGQIIGDKYITADGKKQDLDLSGFEVGPMGNHQAAFVQACRANDPKKVPCGMKEGYYSAALGHFMNISYRMGEKKPFNKKAGRFGDDPRVAEEWLKMHEIARDGIGLPKDETQYTVGPWLTIDPKAETFVGENSERAKTYLQDPRNPEFDIPSPDKV